MEGMNSLLLTEKEAIHVTQIAPDSTDSRRNSSCGSRRLSSGDDKLLQEVVRTILEKIYEPIFEESSHGFGVITFFRAVFPVKQEAIHAEEGK
jgi:hypothetical protein